MKCPSCQSENPEWTEVCLWCAFPLDGEENLNARFSHDPSTSQLESQTQSFDLSRQRVDYREYPENPAANPASNPGYCDSPPIDELARKSPGVDELDILGLPRSAGGSSVAVANEPNLLGWSKYKGRPDSQSGQIDIPQEDLDQNFKDTAPYTPPQEFYEALSDSCPPREGGEETADFVPPAPSETVPTYDETEQESLEFPVSPFTIKTCMLEISSRYQGIEKISETQNSIVYKALDTQRQRQVVVKRLLVKDNSEKSVVEKYLNHARKIAALDHPNIVGMCDIGKDSAGYFIVTEYIDGQLLEDSLKTYGKFGIFEALNMIIAIGDALSYAHKQGVLHGNIKPKNIIVDQNKIPYLLDFGLHRKKSATRSLSRAVYYIAPERLEQGGCFDQRSDIYSLGACFYEMITGDLPCEIRFEGMSEPIAHMVASCLAEHPDERYCSLERMLDDCRKIRNEWERQANASCSQQQATADFDPQQATADIDSQGQQATADIDSQGQQATADYAPEGTHTKNIKTRKEVFQEILQNRSSDLNKREISSTQELLAQTRFKEAIEKKAKRRAKMLKIKVIAVIMAIVFAVSAWQLRSWWNYRYKRHVFKEAYLCARESRKKKSWEEAIEYYQKAQSLKFEGAPENFEAEIRSCELLKKKHIFLENYRQAEKLATDGDWKQALSFYLKAQDAGFNKVEIRSKIEKAQIESRYFAAISGLKQSISDKHWSVAREIYPRAVQIKGETEILKECRQAIPPIELEMRIPENPVAGVRNGFSVVSDSKMCEVTWDFGDGQPKKGAQVEYLFLSKGKYDLKLVVADGVHEIIVQKTLQVDLPAWAKLMVDKGACEDSLMERLIYTFQEQQVMLDMTCKTWDILSHRDQVELASAYQQAYAVASQRPVAGVYEKNGISMKMMLIPPGRYWQGSPSWEIARNSDEKRHRVTITRAFYMGKYEVTQKQWRKIMGSNPSKFIGNGLPVEQVSQQDCLEFCAKTSLDLPTEAQWEYACRAGTTRPFNTGPDINLSRINYDGFYPYLEGKRSKGRQHTVPTGSLPNVNSWGCYDFHGNVWEWTRDWYLEYSGEDQIDPHGPHEGPHRVFRGGSWYSIGSNCRCAFRFKQKIRYRYSCLGFRVLASGETMEKVK